VSVEVIKVNAEEYKSIREEMIQRHRWTVELSFFSVASTGALLSWLSTKSTSAELNPFLFICIGLGIVGFIFHSYLDVLRGIYNQGSYLVVFHERNIQSYSYHTLSRFRNELINKKSDWGKDGRRGGYLLILLMLANIVGTLWFLRANICDFGSDFVWFKIVTILIALLLVCSICYIIYRLFNMRRFMMDNLKGWRQIRDNLEKTPDLLESTIKNVLDS
jgi:hypothetical protein